MKVFRQKLERISGKSKLLILIPTLSTIFLLVANLGQSSEIKELNKKLTNSQNEHVLLKEELASLQEDFDTYQKENKEYIEEGKAIIEKRKKLSRDAEEAVGKMEKTVSRESLNEAKKAVELLDDKEQKEKLTARISTIETKLQEKEKLEAEERLLTEIEAAVTKMEAEQTRENSQAAADKLGQLPNSEKKEHYQKRIDAMNHAINVREAEQQQPQQFAQVPGQSAYYPNCSAVRAAGAAPLYVGQPGYSRKLDRDGDGVACE